MKLKRKTLAFTYPLCQGTVTYCLPALTVQAYHFNFPTITCDLSMARNKNIIKQLHYITLGRANHVSFEFVSFFLCIHVKCGKKFGNAGISNVAN